MFASIFYDQLDPSYRQELLKLENQIKKIKETKTEESNKEIFELLDNFSCKFLMPKKLWDLKIEIAKKLGDFNKIQLAAEYIYHLSYLNMSDRESLKVPYLYDNKLYFDEKRIIPWYPQRYVRLSLKDFCYPHKDLKKNWKEYEQMALTFIPKSDLQCYEKMKKLYVKLTTTDPSNFEEWFQALTEVEDIEFVEQNVEYQIGQNLTNKALWKLYISYLSKNDQKKLLETYSKYCRFFIDDFEMYKKYEKAAEKFGLSKVPWKNTFDFEIYDKNVLNFCVPDLFDDSDDDIDYCVSRYSYSEFDGTNALPQKFPFRPNLMEYIIKNAKAEILFDLFKCCKWFFARFPFPICYKFSVIRGEKKNFRKLAITVRNPNHLIINKPIFVSTVFTYSISDKLCQNSLSKLISKIYRCTAKYVNIFAENLPMNELKFLIGHGNVISMHLFIKDQDCNQFAFEDILKLVPKIQVLHLHNVKYPENLSQYLCDFPFQNKIEEFRLCDMQILPEPHGFAEFMLKNTSTIYSSIFSLRGLKNENNFGDIIDEGEEVAENINFAGESRITRLQRIVIQIFALQQQRNLKPELKII